MHATHLTGCGLLPLPRLLACTGDSCGRNFVGHPFEQKLTVLSIGPGECLKMFASNNNKLKYRRHSIGCSDLPTSFEKVTASRSNSAGGQVPAKGSIWPAMRPKKQSYGNLSGEVTPTCCLRLGPDCCQR